MKILKLTRGDKLAIDLGNNNTVLLGQSEAPSSYPSFVAFNSTNKAVKAVGEEAYNMMGKINKNYKVVKPLRGGVIDDFDSASKLLKALIKIALPHRNVLSRFGYVVSGVPFSTTEVEKRALRD